MFRLKIKTKITQIDCSNVMNNATAAPKMNESFEKKIHKIYHIHILNCGTNNSNKINANTLHSQNSPSNLN